MTLLDVPVCQCPCCQQRGDHPDRALHQQMNLLFSHLDEAQRRWYVALESTPIGHGGDWLLSQITGLDKKIIWRGREELATSLATCPPHRVRQSGGGQPSVEKKIPRYDNPSVASAGGTRDGG